MHYYTVLEATNKLVAQNGWALQRCRRHCDGPLRYVVFDQAKQPVFAEKSNSLRPFGQTLPELLQRLAEEPALSILVKRLLQQLEADVLRE